MIDPSDSAFASPATVVGANDWIDTAKSKGVNVRAWMATHLMAGMLSYPGDEGAGSYHSNCDPCNTARQAVVYADALIAALNEPPKAGG